MNQIDKYVCEELRGVKISCIMIKGEPWFKAKDVATVLKYKDTDDAIRQHVAHDDKRQQGSFILNPGKTPGLKGNWKIAKYINESGLYFLIFGSDMDNAKKSSNIGSHAMSFLKFARLDVSLNLLLPFYG